MMASTARRRPPAFEARPGRTADVARELVKVLGTLTHSTGERPWRIFEDFVAASAASLLALPAHVHAAATGTPFIETDEDADLFARLHERYGPAGQATFGRALALLIDHASEGIQSGVYEDVLGDVYMMQGFGNDAAGQFFTPVEVCRVMARMSAADGGADEVNRRIRAALHSHPLGLPTLVAGYLCDEGEEAARYFFDRVVPLALEIGPEPVTVLDCCVGSGRTLLAAAETYPHWMIEAGMVAFYGQDIDATCVAMCRINCTLYGLRGGPMTAEGWRALRELSGDSPCPAEVAPPKGLEVPPPQPMPAPRPPMPRPRPVAPPLPAQIQLALFS